MARSLKTYTEKRDLKKSSEPKPIVKKSNTANLFVVQKHAASHLHYDFRLEIDGVLVSWAIPKGPSLDPAKKRLAVMTEDHPLEYANFEGIIPEGNYGAGTVMVWDMGTYENIKISSGKPVSMKKCLELGTIEIILHGKKLNGAFALIRTKPGTIRQTQRERDSARNYWLLIKMRDKYAKESDIVKTAPKSALTGKTMSGIEKLGAIYGE